MSSSEELHVSVVTAATPPEDTAHVAGNQSAPLEVYLVVVNAVIALVVVLPAASALTTR